MTGLTWLLPHDGSLELEVIEGNGEFLVRVALGAVESEGGVLSLVVALSPAPGGVPGEMEQVFHVTYAQADDSISQYFDGLDTTRLISAPEHRQMTRNALCAATHELIKRAQPESVFFVTHNNHLPDKALVKYEEIADVYRSCGYDARKGDSWHGQHIWMVKRD